MKFALNLLILAMVTVSTLACTSRATRGRADGVACEENRDPIPLQMGAEARQRAFNSLGTVQADESANGDGMPAGQYFYRGSEVYIRHDRTAPGADLLDLFAFNFRHDRINAETNEFAFSLQCFRGSLVDFEGQGRTEGDFPVATQFTVVDTTPDGTPVGDDRTGEITINSVIQLRATFGAEGAVPSAINASEDEFDELSKIYILNGGQARFYQIVGATEDNPNYVIRSTYVENGITYYVSASYRFYAEGEEVPETEVAFSVTD